MKKEIAIFFLFLLYTNTLVGQFQLKDHPTKICQNPIGQYELVTNGGNFITPSKFNSIYGNMDMVMELHKLDQNI